MNATGPIAVVTGAAGALGSAACGKLADAGFLVLASDADGSAAAALVAGLPGSGHRGMAADVADEESVARLFEVAESEMGPVTALVTFAGILMMEPGRRPSIASSTLAEWRRTFEVNAFGTFLCIREMARLRLKKPVANGRIVTISSIAAQIGSASSEFGLCRVEGRRDQSHEVCREGTGAAGHHGQRDRSGGVRIRHHASSGPSGCGRAAASADTGRTVRSCGRDRVDSRVPCVGRRWLHHRHGRAGQWRISHLAAC